MGKEGIILKHHPNAPFVGRYRIDRPVAKIDLAMGRRFKAGQHHQASRFTRPGGAQHRDKFTALNVQIEVFDD